ncbi:alpha/beta fold hydrolase [Salinarimonas sp.]|uniref:alpha/beta hydrolase n=1 Tax=Salinarimonas sp. TaxID=2766526 RepID=UPI00391D637F
MRAKEPEATMSVVAGDGVRIHAEIYGSGTETMLFVPPWSIVHSRIYKGQVPYFSERFRCIAYDPRGNGSSDRPEAVEAYALERCVGDALAVLDATGTERAVLVGLSLGGLVACMLAAHHPERVAAAILVGTVATIGPSHPYMRPEHFRAQRIDPSGWDKYNRDHWLRDYADFADFFVRQICSEPHATKQIEDALGWAAQTSGEVLVRTIEARAIAPSFDTSAQMYRRIACPVLAIHGDDDRIQPHGRAVAVVEATGGELLTIEGGGHNPLGRYPARCNTAIAEFLERRLRIGRRPRRRRAGPTRRALFVSSPIGLGHARRDIAIARALREACPGLEIEWLAQDPVTRLLAASGERIHPRSARLASEVRHIELEAGEHELHAFQAIRRMDEVLVANFMQFQEVVEETRTDLVVADEAWEVDHFWHEHPDLKRAPLAWLTDFVGWLPMPEGGRAEEALTADCNAEMIEHVETRPCVRDVAIFVGEPQDVVPRAFGPGLPEIPDWTRAHFAFAGYVIGAHPSRFGPRARLREALGYRADERVCIVTAGGSGVGAPFVATILRTWPLVRERARDLRMLVVAGPRIDTTALEAPPGVEIRAFVPDLDRHLAACDLAVVQGGLSTTMELAAAGTPFLFFPLRSHFEQRFHVSHRLARYGVGRRMDYATAHPEAIAEAMLSELGRARSPAPVDDGGAARAAAMIARLL